MFIVICKAVNIIDALLKGVYLIIDGIKLGEDNAIDCVRVLLLRMIREGRVKLDQLINSFVTHQSLSDEEHKIRSVDGDELRKRTHQGLVVLKVRFNNIRQY